MAGNKLVKICVIVGFILAETYMVFVVLAPVRAPGSPEPTSRMIIQKEMIPKFEGIAPGTSSPPGTMAVKLAVCAFFFGPFGACVGLGVGLLLDGARQKLASSRGESLRQP